MNFQKERVTNAEKDAPDGEAFKNPMREICMDTADGQPNFRKRSVARMAELADATDSKSVAL
jgi:hypothetical protein